MTTDEIITYSNKKGLIWVEHVPSGWSRHKFLIWKNYTLILYGEKLFIYPKQGYPQNATMSMIDSVWLISISDITDLRDWLKNKTS